LDLAVEINDNVTLEDVEVIAPSKYVVFSDDDHWDLASWMQGSIQASDPDAAVFALAKWLESGEDPRYIARRIMVSASEDATYNPLAALVAHNAYVAACNIGRPECDIIMAHAVVLIACSKRDKSAACSIWNAVKDVRDGVDVAVPKEMRDSHYSGAGILGHGAYKDGMVQSAFVGVKKRYYEPPSFSPYQNLNWRSNNGETSERV